MWMGVVKMGGGAWKWWVKEDEKGQGKEGTGGRARLCTGEESLEEVAIVLICSLGFIFPALT